MSIDERVARRRVYEWLTQPDPDEALPDADTVATPAPPELQQRLTDAPLRARSGNDGDGNGDRPRTIFLSDMGGA